MRPAARFLLAVALLAIPAIATAQNAGVLRVTVQDETQYVLPHAVVTLVDPGGVERQVLVNESGVAEFRGLTPGEYTIRVAAEGFYGYGGRYTVKRGNNNVTATLPVALAEEIEVSELSPEQLRDKGFTQSLSQDEIDALSDDPDEMAEQLRQMAGPGAQIMVNGFRGARIPPKDEIQQIRLHTNSFAAEYHEAGQVRVEIITKPGMGAWRGGFNFGFRDEALNAKNYFASEKAPEQTKRFSFNSQGPIRKGRTSITFNAEGNLSYDAQTIVAEVPGGAVNEQVKRPVDTMFLTARVEHQLGGGNTIRAEFSRRNQLRRNNGVGDFDLPERGFDSRTIGNTLRVWNTKVYGRKLFSETRVEFQDTFSENTPYSMQPTIRVNEAFTAGGAGQLGSRAGRELTLIQNFDFAVRKHQLRFGAEINGGWWDSTTQTNANGTFTFPSLTAYEAGLPRTFTRRVGDPLVSYSQIDAGWYLQDDFRLTRNINVSLGLRQELQTNYDDHLNLAPRASFAYLLGKGTVRGGYGMFYDWMDSSLYEQTLRVDGLHQIEETIVNPSYPAVGNSTGTVLPPSRIQLGPHMTQPTIHQASIGYERPLGNVGQFRLDYQAMRGTHTLRSINVNAPLLGVRPDPAAGNVTQIESTGKRYSDRFSVGLNLRAPARRIIGNVTYQWANVRAYSDGPTALPANSNDPDADWGPTAQDARHRIFGMINSPVGAGIRAGFQLQYSSALPYNITSGIDTNGDTLFNDRPAGVTRNSARGASQWNSSLRLNRSFSLGSVLAGPGIVGGGPMNSSSAAAQGPGGGPGGGAVMIMDGGGSARYRLDVYAQVMNLFNATNLNQFVGNLQSPYYGTATSALPPRKIEVGLSLFF